MQKTRLFHTALITAAASGLMLGAASAAEQSGGEDADTMGEHGCNAKGSCNASKGKDKKDKKHSGKGEDGEKDKHSCKAKGGCKSQKK